MTWLPEVKVLLSFATYVSENSDRNQELPKIEKLTERKQKAHFAECSKNSYNWLCFLQIKFMMCFRYMTISSDRSLGRSDTRILLV